MGGKLRRRELIPEDTQVTATLNDLKLVHGKFGRQVELKVQVVKGDYKGTEFKEWLSFGKDKEDGEEYIPYGAPLYQALAMVEPELDAVLEDENLTEKKYQQFLKQAVSKLEGFEIMARIGVKAPKEKPENKRNILQHGGFGPVQDPEEVFEDLEMTKAPF